MKNSLERIHRGIMLSQRAEMQMWDLCTCGAIAPAPSRKHSTNKPKLTSKLCWFTIATQTKDYFYGAVLHHVIWYLLTALNAGCYYFVWSKCFWSQRRSWDHSASVFVHKQTESKKIKIKITALAGCIVNILVNSTKLFHNLITERKVLMTSLYIA